MCDVQSEALFDGEWGRDSSSGVETRIYTCDAGCLPDAGWDIALKTLQRLRSRLCGWRLKAIKRQ